MIVSSSYHSFGTSNCELHSKATVHSGGDSWPYFSRNSAVMSSLIPPVRT